MSELHRSARQMTLFLAYITGGPPSPDWQIQLCVYVPVVTVIVSWLLMRWKRRLVWGAVALAFSGALFVLLSFQEYLDSILWLYPAKPWSLIVAPWIATAVPFLVIWRLYLTGSEGPNK